MTPKQLQVPMNPSKEITARPSANDQVKKVYLAGPMSGIPDLNFPAFHAEAARLRGLGYQVVNPAELNPSSNDWLECMRIDIRELVLCDGVMVMPGWECSRGAKLEHDIARGLGLAVMPCGEARAVVAASGA